MQLAYEILRLMSDGKFHSGTLLAHDLKVARSSIWNAIHYLRTRGIQIHAVSGKGYRLAQSIEWICKHEIYGHLLQNFHVFFPRIEVLNVVTSTNDYLLQRLGQVHDKSMVCIALEQTHGKGRGGKTWYSPIGSNIYLSFTWRFQAKLFDLSGLSLVVGLIVIDAIESYYGHLPKELGIKWPNDVWFRNQKLCGILIESISKGMTLSEKTQTDLVIGIGLNTQIPQNSQLNFNATDLSHIFGEIPSKNKLIALLLMYAVNHLTRFAKEGLTAFSSRWSQLDLLAGKSVQLTTTHHQEIGIAEGINERGELCVQVNQKLKAFRYGEVSVCPAS